MEQDFSVSGALMPDAHTGYSLPIGAVVATKDVVVPAWVGYDIGCGVCALPTTFNCFDVASHSKDIFAGIYKQVPVGFSVNEHAIDCSLDADALTPLGKLAFDKRKGFRSLGTLGGGNHFIEIGKDEVNRVWIIVHSGSRGLGHGIATEYMRLASGTGKVKEGHYALRCDSADGQSYINDLNWSLSFALFNRVEIVRRVVQVIASSCDGDGDFDGLINRNHNHAEHKDGEWIHRKGATHAESGMLGVIPGNMRDGSFIVKGKGNPDSLCSSSHGAGRAMGRKQAKVTLKTDEFKKIMAGITAKVDDSTLDESPTAYKDIFTVMRLQTDLVEVLHHISPIINVKG